MSRKATSITTIALAVALGIGGYVWFRKNNANQGPPKISVGYSRLRISLPIFVAAHKGYFKEEGLDVELQPFDTAQPLMDALVSGHIKVGGYTAFPITFNAMLRSGTQLYFASLLVEDEKHPISMLLKKKGSSLTKVTDLKGKRVGILPTIAYKAWLEDILRDDGVDPKSVTIVQVQPPLTPSALQSGQIDAAFTNDPAATTSIQKGVAELLTQEALVPKHIWSPFPFGAFNLRKDFADANPEAVRKLMNALNRAIDYTNAHPDEVKEIMKDFLPDEQDPFVHFYPDALFVRSDKVQDTEIKRIGQSYLEMGIIDKPIQLDGLVYR